MSALEVVAVLFGLCNIALLVRRSIWNFPAALVMVTLYAIVFYRTRLYSDMLLQGFFFAVNVYGWWAWARGPHAADGAITVRRMPQQGFALAMAAGAVATAGWGWLMHRFTDAAFPWWDAAVAAFSVTAQILLTRRFIENWWLWIGVDAGAAALYLTRGLYLTAALYLLFLLMCLWGLAAWRRAERPAA